LEWHNHQSSGVDAFDIHPIFNTQSSWMKNLCVGDVLGNALAVAPCFVFTVNVLHYTSP